MGVFAFPLHVDKAQTIGAWIALPIFMSTAPTHAMALPTQVPLGVDMHYETEHRTVWNEEERKQEEHEFVYEVSWVPELGVWRRFLRTHRKA